MKVERIYMGAATTCLDARGNAGGAYIQDIECGAYAHGMYWDGSLDTVRIVNWHHWPFGDMNIGLTPLHALYNDGQVECMNIGRIDDFKAVNVGCFQASLHVTSTANPNLGMAFNNLSMDGYGSTITMDAGRVNISNGYTTHGTDTNGVAGAMPNLTMNGGFLELSNWDINAGLLSVPAISLVGGAINMTNSSWSSQSAPNLISVSAGVLQVSNSSLSSLGGGGLISVAAGALNIANSRLALTAGTSLLAATGGVTNIVGGSINCSNTNTDECIKSSTATTLSSLLFQCNTPSLVCGHSTGGTLAFNNIALSPLFGSTYTVPFLKQDLPGFLQVNASSFVITGAGEGVHFNGDGNLNRFTNNIMTGWTFTLPNVRTSPYSEYQIPGRWTYAALIVAAPCVGGIVGSHAVVTDATTPTYNAPITGGGTFTVDAMCNADGWRSH
jgi:hypothetical protein